MLLIERYSFLKLSKLITHRKKVELYREAKIQPKDVAVRE